MMKFMVVVLGIIVFSTTALAHSWYETSCCSGNDCAEVIEAQKLPDGNTLVTTKHGQGIVNPKTDKRPSKDAVDHACLVTMPSSMVDPAKPNLKYVRCYYIPAGS